MQTRFHQLLRASQLASVLCAVLPGVSHVRLVSYWPLNGDANAGVWGASTVVSGTNGENDISYLADVPAEISGRVSRSLAFDANNDDRVVTAFHSGTAGISGTPATTISYWIKRSADATTFRGMVSLGSTVTAPGTLISMERSAADALAAYYFDGNRISAGGFAAD